MNGANASIATTDGRSLRIQKLRGLRWGSQPEAASFTPVRFARNGDGVGALVSVVRGQNGSSTSNTC